MPPPGYLAGVRALADEYGIMLILDEVMAGFGRTGEWFAFDAFDVVPDLITFAKGVNSGYVPVGGVVISDPIAAHLRRPGVPRRPDLQRASAGGGVDRRRRSTRWTTRASSTTHAKRIGADVLGPGLATLADKHPVIGEVRGAGVFWALELVADRDDPRAAVAQR